MAGVHAGCRNEGVEVVSVVELLSFLTVSAPTVGSLLGGFWWYRLLRQRLDLYRHVIDEHGPKSGVEVIKAMRRDFPAVRRDRRTASPRSNRALTGPS